MTLREQFKNLAAPDGKNVALLHAADIASYPFAKLGVNYQGMPIVLINSIKQAPSSLRNHRLKYLELNVNSECVVKKGGVHSSGNYSLISFRSTAEGLTRYFFSIITIFLESLATASSVKEIQSTYQDLIEIFRSLNEAPVSTIQGLWSEVFLIDRSTRPDSLLSFWHSNPKNKFDFEAGEDKLEVKSTRSTSRIHTFSAEQLNADESFNILIASLFVIENEKGKSLQELMRQLEAKLGTSAALFKLKLVTAKTLGAGLEESSSIKYDDALAAASLRFYDRREIDKIESQSIPSRVSEVHFKSDLSMIRSINPIDIYPESLLFNAL